jgi:protein-disulfide isomerase
MNRFKFLIVLLIPLFFTLGCTPDKKLGEIEKNQKDILTKLTAIEGNQEKLLKGVKPGKPSVDVNKVHQIPIGNSPVKGDVKAPVTIFEFSDFQCPYCSKLQPTLRQVLDAYPGKVKLVFKNFPLSFHKQANNAAKASLAAGEQGKYWEMHDKIFEKFNKLTEKSFAEFATELGLDTNKFAADFGSNKYDGQIQQDMQIAKKVGVRGTPTLFINGKLQQGRSFDDFKRTIEGLLKK